MTDPTPAKRRAAHVLVLSECLALMTDDELNDVGRFLKYRGYVDKYKDAVKASIEARRCK